MTTYILCASSAGTLTFVAGVGIFLLITLLLVIVLLIAKKCLVNSGSVTININNDKNVEAESGKSLLSTLADQNIFLPSACGGKGSCAQCKVRVLACANARSWKAAAKFCPPKPSTLPAVKCLKAGASDAS